MVQHELLGYICLFRGQRYETHATSAYAAQVKAIEHFKPSRRTRHLVTVHLAEKGGEQVNTVITN